MGRRRRPEKNMETTTQGLEGLRIILWSLGKYHLPTMENKLENEINNWVIVTNMAVLDCLYNRSIGTSTKPRNHPKP